MGVKMHDHGNCERCDWIEVERDRLADALRRWRIWWVNDGRTHGSNPTFESYGDKLAEDTLALLKEPRA